MEVLGWIFVGVAVWMIFRSIRRDGQQSTSTPASGRDSSSDRFSIADMLERQEILRRARQRQERQCPHASPDLPYPSVPPAYRREWVGNAQAPIEEDTATPGSAHRRNANGQQSSSKPGAAQTSSSNAALNAVDRGDRIVFVVGRAGTGKTTLVHELRQQSEKQVVLAPTGIAALNAGGETIHSFFKFPPRIINTDEIKIQRNRQNLYKNLDRIIIDEVSMVRADMIDSVDRALRVNRQINAPFGGLQVVLFGDFFQLPPPIQKDDWLILANLGYRMHYALGAKIFNHIKPTWTELTTVYRQSDRFFLEILGAIRNGADVPEAVVALNQACHRAHRPGHCPVLLVPTNRLANIYNEQEMDLLRGESRIYHGRNEGKCGFHSKRSPAPVTLELKPGARVMAVANDPQKRWVNGSLGWVIKTTEDGPLVRFDRGEEATVTAFTWEDIRYRWNTATGRVEVDVVATYTQIPLVLGWAITIHKSQGLTLDDVRIDFGEGAFASGQAYVALSRARTLGGLSLARPIRVADIQVDRQLAEYLRTWQPLTS